MHVRSHRWIPILLVLALAPALPGCVGAEGATSSNFSLAAQKLGWYAGEEAHFVLAIEASFFRSDPSFTVDRHFAIEEIKFEQTGLKFGGDFDTRNPDDVSLRLARDNATGDEFLLDAAAPTLDVYAKLPADLKDSSYTMSIKLFKVGWVESDEFRVDVR